MTNERNERETDADDERVSRAYREIATERAPAHLDAAILRQAAKVARPAYQRSITWTRPFAWVAVVAICLAITLQVTQLPVPDEVPAVPAVESDARTDSPGAFSGSSDRASEPAKAEQAHGVVSDAAKTRQQADVPAEALEEVQKRIDNRPPEQASRAAAPLEATLDDAAVVPETIEMQDADMLRRAEDMVRQRAGANKEAESAASGISAFAHSSTAATLDPPRCSDEVRQDPDNWSACIRRLEQLGLHDEVASERDELAAAFPDYEAPDATE